MQALCDASTSFLCSIGKILLLDSLEGSSVTCHFLTRGQLRQYLANKHFKTMTWKKKVENFKKNKMHSGDIPLRQREW